MSSSENNFQRLAFFEESDMQERDVVISLSTQLTRSSSYFGVPDNNFHFTKHWVLNASFEEENIMYRFDAIKKEQNNNSIWETFKSVIASSSDIITRVEKKRLSEHS